MVAEKPPEERSWVRGAQRYFPRLQEVFYAKVSPPVMYMCTGSLLKSQCVSHFLGGALGQRTKMTL